MYRYIYVHCFFFVSWFCLALPLLEDQTSVEWRLFESFMTNFSRNYRNDSETLQHRFQVFQQSLERHRALNAYEAEHGGTAVYGINKFSDLTPEEFSRLHLSVPRPAVSGEYFGKNREGLDIVEDVPDKFDWRDKNMIGPIRDQKQCGSCWAFAVVESIASRYAIINGGKLYQLSPQQLISCDYNPSQSLYGCKGGTILNALTTIEKENMTIVLEKAYPFASANGENLQCKANLPNAGMNVSKYKFSNQITADEMTGDLYQFGPLTTSVNAVSWQDYVGGIIQHHCNSVFYDHAIQIVGYDKTNVIPYWIIRNTWGPNWGEKGYVRIKLGDNMCGLRNEVASVIDVNGVNI